MVLNHQSGDWSIAVGAVLTRHFARYCSQNMTHLEIYQPTLSRVWHVGALSSVGSNHTKHIRTLPTWYNLTLLEKDGSISLIPGFHDWYGFSCTFLNRKPGCSGSVTGKYFPLKHRFDRHFIPNISRHN